MPKSGENDIVTLTRISFCNNEAFRYVRMHILEIINDCLKEMTCSTKVISNISALKKLAYRGFSLNI